MATTPFFRRWTMSMMSYQCHIQRPPRFAGSQRKRRRGMVMEGFYRRLLLVDCRLECALRFSDLVFSHRRPLRCQPRAKACRCLLAALQEIISCLLQLLSALTLPKRSEDFLFFPCKCCCIHSRCSRRIGHSRTASSRSLARQPCADMS